MDNGFIILHRKILSWEWYQDSDVKAVFLHLLLKANHKDNRWQGILIKRGQLVTSYDSIFNELNRDNKTGKLVAKTKRVTIRNIRTALSRLKMTGELTIETTTKYSLITINNYDSYQKNDKPNARRTTSKRQANDKQVTTNNNDNNVNNDNNNIADESAKPINEVNLLISKFEPINPSFKRLFANKTQRSAMERLINEHSFERMETLLNRLPEIVSQPYAPKITTPLELEKGFGRLMLFVKQESSNNKKRGGVVDVG